MGLSLSVVVAICLLLPGVAFIFGLTRLHNPNAPGSSLDQHLSLSLALMVASALLFQGLWLLVRRLIAGSAGWPLPDAGQAIALLGGDLDSPAAGRALASLEHYPARIGAYFTMLPALVWALGRWANGELKRRPAANWLDLLGPADVLFVWMTADLHLEGRCYLYSGPVKEFSVSKAGDLERVVLGYASRRPLDSAAVQPCADDAHRAVIASAPDGVAVLVLADVRIVSLNYFYGSNASRTGTQRHVMARTPTPPLPQPAWVPVAYQPTARRSAWRSG
ncbi:MAG TPA: hypothetical protein VD865_11450 [Stenotrophomonas sp.]|nr:hypothetical protein [Stenotrophomonas sp.]